MSNIINLQEQKNIYSLKNAVKTSKSIFNLFINTNFSKTEQDLLLKICQHYKSGFFVKKINRNNEWLRCFLKNFKNKTNIFEYIKYARGKIHFTLKKEIAESFENPERYTFVDQEYFALKSKYSKLIYFKICLYRDLGKVYWDEAQLKKDFNRKKMKVLNSRILKPAIAEINENTNFLIEKKTTRENVHTLYFSSKFSAQKTKKCAENLTEKTGMIELTTKEQNVIKGYVSKFAVKKQLVVAEMKKGKFMDLVRLYHFVLLNEKIKNKKSFITKCLTNSNYE